MRFALGPYGLAWSVSPFTKAPQPQTAKQPAENRPAALHLAPNHSRLSSLFSSRHSEANFMGEI